MTAEEKRNFYIAISYTSGLHDRKMAQAVINSFTRLIERQLKNHGYIEIPGLGKFVLVERKARNMHIAKTGEIKRISSKKEIKFRPDYKLKNKFKDLYTEKVYIPDKILREV